MSRASGRVGAVAALGAWLVCGCMNEPEPRTPSLLPPRLLEAVRPGEPIRPIPPASELAGDERQVGLGRRLFVDPALSQDRTTRCIDCHPFERGGADPRPRSIGVGGAAGIVQAPSIFNLAFNHCYNWDGRTCDLAAHARIPLGNPRVMGMDPERVVARLASESDYAERFAAAYPDGLTLDNVAHALGAYERTLVTPNSPVDRYLLGEDGALSPEELAGYRLFKAIGCVSCHQGTNVGGNLFQRFGVLGELDARPDAPPDAYTGRERVTGRPEDRRVFRVPGLRNVALTAPYFHDASAATLHAAVRVMARHQLGHELDDEQVARLVAFLGALTGELPEAPRGE
jgi:cytochrome c peroxidase